MPLIFRSVLPHPSHQVDEPAVSRRGDLIGDSVGGYDFHGRSVLSVTTIESDG